MFSDEYEDISAYREIELVTTTTTTTVQPPIELDPIMQAMMQTVNITELEIRFGHIDENGLAVRNAFGEPLDVAAPQDTYRWDFNHLNSLTSVYCKSFRLCLELYNGNGKSWAEGSIWKLIVFSGVDTDHY